MYRMLTIFVAFSCACLFGGVNRNWGRLDGQRIVYAPDVLDSGLSAPSSEDFRERGWLEIDRSAPEVRDGLHVETYAWTNDSGRIWRAYTYGTNDHPVVRYSKLKLGNQLDALGVYDLAEAWMVSNSVFRQWRDAQYFESNYPVLIQATNLVVRAGLVTGEQMRAALEAARDE